MLRLTLMIKSVLVVCAFPLAVLSLPAQAVESSQLWLPRSEYRHFNSLRRAAEIAEQTERCRYVIAGSLNRSRSRDDHPVFTITCRDASRQTFAWVVDGNTMTILNRPEPEAEDPQAVARERARQRLANQWQQCFQQLAQRTAGLRQVQGFNGDVPETVEQSAAAATFAVDFSARGRDRQPLHYRAECHVSDQHTRLTIQPRRETASQPTQTAAQSADEPAAAEPAVGG